MLYHMRLTGVTLDRGHCTSTLILLSRASTCPFGLNRKGLTGTRRGSV